MQERHGVWREMARTPRTARSLGALIISLLVAVWLHGCGRDDGVGGDRDLRTTRKMMVSRFERADTLEVYTVTWPGEYERQHLLCSISRREHPEVWRKALAALRRAGPRAYWHGCVPQIHIRLRAHGQTIATGWATPQVNEIGLYLPKRERIVLWSAELAALLRPFHDQVVAAQAKANPVPPEQPEPPLPSFAEVKPRFIKLFRECEYINLYAEDGNAIGVDIRGEAAHEWRVMTEAVEHATKGWAIPGGKPEAYIGCDVPWTGLVIELEYVGGVLGCADRYYGGNIQTLRPGPGFQEALYSMQRRAREKRKRSAAPSAP